MALDAYIEFEGISGKSLDEQHENWIEIVGYNFGTHQSVSATASSAGGASSGRTTMISFNFSKFLDASSCKLMEASCSGQHFKKVTIAVHRAGGDKLKCYEVVLEEVIISDYSQSASDGVPREVVKLDYGRIKTCYTQQRRSDGGGGRNVARGWDRIKNKIYS